MSWALGQPSQAQGDSEGRGNHSRVHCPGGNTEGTGVECPAQGPRAAECRRVSGTSPPQRGPVSCALQSPRDPSDVLTAPASGVSHSSLRLRHTFPGTYLGCEGNVFSKEHTARVARCPLPGCPGHMGLHSPISKHLVRPFWVPDTEFGGARGHMLSAVRIRISWARPTWVR